MRGNKILCLTHAGFYEQGVCDSVVSVLNDYGDIVTRVFQYGRLAPYQKWLVKLALSPPNTIENTHYPRF